MGCVVLFFFPIHKTLKGSYNICLQKNLCRSLVGFQMKHKSLAWDIAAWKKSPSGILPPEHWIYSFLFNGLASTLESNSSLVLIKPKQIYFMFYFYTQIISYVLISCTVGAFNFYKHSWDPGGLYWLNKRNMQGICEHDGTTE